MACLLDSGKPYDPAQGEADFTPAERAAIAYAEELTKDPKAVSDATFTDLRKYWNERQVVELTAAACLFNAFNRFNNALAMDLTVYPKALNTGPSGGCE